MTTRLDIPGPDSLEDRQVDQQLHEVEERLLARYLDHRDVSRDRVLDTLASLRQRFSTARIRTFLPILIERAARAELGH